MKRTVAYLCAMFSCLCFLGCSRPKQTAQIVATTLPVYDFTKHLCRGTDIKITRLINEDIACLHDYSLQVSQMQALECAEVVLSSGAGLEDFLEDVKTKIPDVVDLSAGITLLCEEGHDHHDDHESVDAHYWLSPNNSKIMAANIYQALTKAYPQYKDTFENNLKYLNTEFDKLQNYANSQLNDLSGRKLITFHNGFSYMADAFGLEIIHSVAEESGSEASAQELIKLATLVQEYDIPAIFTEKNGSTAAATIIAKEMDIRSFSLDMAMSGDSYFEAMYYNINTLKGALE